MADIAEIGFRADTRELKDAKTALDEIKPSAEKAEAAANKLGDANEKLGESAKKSANEIKSNTLAMEKAAVAATADATAVNRAAIANDVAANAARVSTTAMGQQSVVGARVTATNSTLAASAGQTTIANNAAAAAAQRLAMVEAELAGMTARLAVAEEAATAAGAGLAASNTAVAVSAGEAAIATRAAGIGIGGMIGGLAVGAITLGLFVGVIAAAIAGAITFAGAFLDLKESVGKTTEGMGLTEKQLDRLKAKGIDTGITLKDAFYGFGHAIGQAIKDALDGPLKDMKDKSEKLWDDIVTFSSNAFDKIMHVSIGSVAAIIAVWDELPGAFADIFMQTVNNAIDGYNTIVKAGWDFLFTIVDIVEGIPAAIGNAFITAVELAAMALVKLWGWVKSNFDNIVYLWYNWPQILGSLFVKGVEAAFSSIIWLFNKSVEIIKSLWAGAKALLTGEIPHFENSFTGQAAHAADTAANAYARAGTAYDKFRDKFKADFRTGTMNAHDARLKKAAGAPGHPKKEPKGPKTDAEKFEDIATGAQNDIDKENARALAAGLDMTAEAAATLAEKTKLLSEAKSKDITLTIAMRTRIDELAAAYGKAKVAADNAVGLHEVLKTSDADIANIKAQTEMIGLYGRQLAYATEMMRLLAEAKTKNMTPDAIAAARPQFEQRANQYADASATKDHAAFMEEQRRAAKENAIALGAERAAIGLNADETNRLRIETEMLAAARKKNIDLSPAEIADLKQIADEQAAAENAIRKTKEAIDFAKDTAKGFFTDFFDDLRKGKSLWDSFGDAAMNALNKIIDKLLDKAITALVDFIFKSFGYADGGAFNNGVQTFASGGMFTNTVVNRPTPFAFANGAALGVMGEAGPEAIMPLKRGGDGTLGVQMYGNGTGAAPTYIHAPVTVNNDNRVTGAVSSADIIALQKAQGEATTRDVKRNLSTWIGQYQRDGAIAS
jgi:hypothetical protein